MKNLILLLLVSVPAADTYTWPEALEAIRQVETGGEPREGLGAVGDGGSALGPFQIWKPYWIDAAIKGREYREVLNDRALSELVVTRYMRRYAPNALRRLQASQGSLEDLEKISRIHNGGPRGHLKSATLRYWQRVRGMLTRGVLPVITSRCN